jgi:hypothetical protein
MRYRSVIVLLAGRPSAVQIEIEIAAPGAPESNGDVYSLRIEQVKNNAWTALVRPHLTDCSVSLSN